MTLEICSEVVIEILANSIKSAMELPEFGRERERKRERERERKKERKREREAKSSEKDASERKHSTNLLEKPLMVS